MKIMSDHFWWIDMNDNELRARLAALVPEMRSQLRRLTENLDLSSVPAVIVQQWANEIEVWLRELPAPPRRRKRKNES
jgi:hypothetical protein